MNEDKHPFVEFLEKHAEDRAMLAELRRGLGREPGEVPGMFPYVIPFVHNSYDEANIYLIASLFALHPSSTGKGNMGEHLYTLTQAVGDDDATTRRFVQLLRQSRDSLDVPLRQHISMLKSKDIAVNWNQLLRDLHYWEHPDHFVQKQWAAAYWKSGPNKSK
ncbi:MAG: type I-E CRISPR-associated protein Cse2/CasB [Phototrophicales bacterium]|nr:MAG: type I-E CRISPR-associated protein Cse2/CasB [Phototrophicales bacterium]RMG70780.1 MAG: type I-E CRISPR-associated protein Cse2/CasB [Chloroflexota bacterium]